MELFQKEEHDMKSIIFPPALVVGFGFDKNSKEFVSEFGNKWDTDEEMKIFILFSESRNIIADRKSVV